MIGTGFEIIGMKIDGLINKLAMRRGLKELF